MWASLVLLLSIRCHGKIASTGVCYLTCRTSYGSIRAGYSSKLLIAQSSSSGGITYSIRLSPHYVVYVLLFPSVQPHKGHIFLLSVCIIRSWPVFANYRFIYSPVVDIIISSSTLSPISIESFFCSLCCCWWCYCCHAFLSFSDFLHKKPCLPAKNWFGVVGTRGSFTTVEGGLIRFIREKQLRIRVSIRCGLVKLCSRWVKFELKCVPPTLLISRCSRIFLRSQSEGVVCLYMRGATAAGQCFFGITLLPSLVCTIRTLERNRLRGK